MTAPTPVFINGSEQTMADYQPECANCGHSHTYDGPFQPLKTVDTPCWKCGCDDYQPATTDRCMGCGAYPDEHHLCVGT